MGEADDFDRLLGGMKQFDREVMVRFIAMYSPFSRQRTIDQLSMIVFDVRIGRFKAAIMKLFDERRRAIAERKPGWKTKVVNLNRLIGEEQERFFLTFPGNGNPSAA